jgi:hypothetical protein
MHLVSYGNLSGYNREFQLLISLLGPSADAYISFGSSGHQARKYYVKSHLQKGCLCGFRAFENYQ